MNNLLNIFRDDKKLSWLIITFGISLYFRAYFSNRSLWLDEARLALNIIDRSLSSLLLPLDYGQGAPIGFLIVEKILVEILGNNEYILRLFPFICGIISLFLFYNIAKHYIEIKTIPIALILFVNSYWLTYYPSEAKQYSSDVTIALFLYFMVNYVQKNLTTLRIVLFGITGGIVIWFSHSSVFILAGLGLSLFLLYFVRNEWLNILKISIAYSIWILSFTVCYFFFLENLSQNKWLISYWELGFAPFPPKSISDIKWFMKTFFYLFEHPVGLDQNGITAFAFLAGFTSMFLKKKKQFLFLISPIPFVLLASGLHKYPFFQRFLLFIVPFVLLFVAEGAEQICAKASINSAIKILFIGLLILPSLFSSGMRLIKPITVEENKLVIDYMKKNWQQGDMLYLYHYSWPAFAYYSKNYGFTKKDYVIGIIPEEEAFRKNYDYRKWKKYAEDMAKLRNNKRVWVLLSHIFECEKKTFLYHVDNIGTRLDFFAAPGAEVYLYDLSRSESAP